MILFELGICLLKSRKAIDIVLQKDLRVSVAQWFQREFFLQKSVKQSLDLQR